MIKPKWNPSCILCLTLAICEYIARIRILSVSDLDISLRCLKLPTVPIKPSKRSPGGNV